MYYHKIKVTQNFRKVKGYFPCRRPSTSAIQCQVRGRRPFLILREIRAKDMSLILLRARRDCALRAPACKTAFGRLRGRCPLSTPAPRKRSQPAKATVRFRFVKGKMHGHSAALDKSNSMVNAGHGDGGNRQESLNPPSPYPAYTMEPLTGKQKAIIQACGAAPERTTKGRGQELVKTNS